ncbi:MAG: DUF3987 domain-containing protein [Myxococcales bacterium]|nr:DUF3987 domain-containing protein [Myxococcales bacterium]
MSGVKMIPYHLPELLDAIYAGDSIHIVEGEKDVEAVEAARGVATCNPMGAGKDVKQYAEYFEGAELIRVIADRDEVGRRHAQAWVDALQLIVPQVELLEAVEGKDAHDSLVTHGHSLETAFSRIQPEEPAATQAEHDEELFAPLQPFTLRYGPDFPTYTLPDNLREMVEHLAEAQQIPAAVVAPWMLGTVAACVARKFEASPRIGWDEPLNMFVIGALPPATRKSGTLRALAAPFTEHERKYNDEHRDEREAGEQLVRLMERRLAKAEKFHAEAGEDAEAEAFAKATVAREALSEARRAATGRLTLFTADMTPESAAALMEQNGERLACISGEGDEFFALMRRYSANGAVNQDAYLKFHSGDHHRVNRKNSATIDLEHPALTLVLAVQTSVVQSIRLDTELRERGMVARLLFAVPESTLGRRKIAAAPVPRDVEQRYAKMIAWLLDAHGDRVAIEFTDEADNLLRDFEAELEPKLGERGELASISDWAGKLAGLIVRVAGTLHCAVAANELQRPENSNISEETVARAIEIGRWALEHARVALGVAWENDPEAERVWHWVTSRAIPLAEFSARDAFDKSRGRNEKMAPTNQGLAGLVERGFLRQLPEPDSGRSGGRRRSPQYQVNPEALSLSSQAA